MLDGRGCSVERQSSQYGTGEDAVLRQTGGSVSRSRMYIELDYRIKPVAHGIVERGNVSYLQVAVARPVVSHTVAPFLLCASAMAAKVEHFTSCARDASLALVRDGVHFSR